MNIFLILFLINYKLQISIEFEQINQNSMCTNEIIHDNYDIQKFIFYNILNFG